MAEKFDPSAIKNNTNLVELVSRYMQLQKSGAEYKGLCIFHDDHNPSFYVNEVKNICGCFRCGEHYDAISFLMAVEQIEFPEACKRLLNGGGTGNSASLPNPKPVAQREYKKPPPRITTPPPDGTPPPDMKIKGLGGAPSVTWEYKTPEGATWGYVARYETKEGKTIRVWSWGSRGESDPPAWACGHFTAPRPMYGLEKLAKRPKAQILLCEGEKAADAAAILFPSLLAMTWPGGAQAVKYVDWSPLQGRECVLFPDNDAAGIDCMAAIAAALHKAGASKIKGIRVATQPDGSDTPDKWDIADADGWTPQTALAWAKPRVFTYPTLPTQQTHQTDEISTPDAPDIPHDETPPFPPLEAYGGDGEQSGYPDTTEPLTGPTAPASAAIQTIAGDPLPLAVNDKGVPLQNLDNATRAIQLDHALGGHIWYDEFLDAIITDWQGAQRQWVDADDVKLCVHLQRNMGLTRISVGLAHDAALMAAMHDRRNEVHDYLSALEWDGTERLPYLLSDGFGADHNAYTQAVGRCWMVSMVARALKPGCKVDTVPVLEGKQGKQKSSALSIIGGKWFVECHENVMSKDFYGVLTGHILVEISEMHSFTRAEVERIKGIISCQIDRYRKAYGRHTEDHPRQTVLVGTTNRDDYHKDETGGRRFLPVLCQEVSLHWLRENRDQLWAEATHRYRSAPDDATPEQRIAAGAAWWDFPEPDQAREINARRDVDSWESTIESWLNNSARRTVMVGDILADCLEIETKEHDQMRQKRVARVLRALGWVNKVRRGDDGKQRKVWIKDE